MAPIFLRCLLKARIERGGNENVPDTEKGMRFRVRNYSVGAFYLKDRASPRTLRHIFELWGMARKGLKSLSCMQTRFWFIAQRHSQELLAAWYSSGCNDKQQCRAEGYCFLCKEREGVRTWDRGDLRSEIENGRPRMPEIVRSGCEECTKLACCLALHHRADIILLVRKSIALDLTITKIHFWKLYLADARTCRGKETQAPISVGSGNTTW
jgi:hypothetical protein